MASASNSGRLFFLDLGAGRILSVNPDGSDLKTVLTEGQGPHPDGVVVDAGPGHIYWTNMGNFNANDGSIERCDLNGKSRRFGGGKFYWTQKGSDDAGEGNLTGIAYPEFP